MTPEAGRIVILNGVGSAGKSTIARQLQAIARRPLLHVEMDRFLDMLPPAYFGNADGLLFEPLPDRVPPEVAIHSGPIVLRLLDGMRAAVAAMARAGNHVILDDVILDGDASAFREAFAGLTVHWVGVAVALEIAEARERARGDRKIGLARWQHGRVHRGMSYDLMVDSGSQTAEACAETIRKAFHL
ncbi:MAG: chloramphenicol phosphotransferase [Alphaproteobacteria bacterium]|nr:chloramphenicol phosphotransferase [Alphaproteobacteria bacterium]